MTSSVYLQYKIWLGRNCCQVQRASFGLPFLSLPSLRVNTGSTEHSPVQEHLERGVCGLHSAFAEGCVCVLALSSAGMAVLSQPNWRSVYLCGFWHALRLTFSNENVLVGAEHGRAQPSSAPGLRARLPCCLFAARLPPLCKHTHLHLKQVDFPGQIIIESSLPTALNC